MRMIDADKLIKDIDYSADLGGALGRVVEVVKTYAKFMVQTASTVESQQWIPVTERLPEEVGMYQVTNIYGNVVRYVFNCNESSENYWKRCVKAWMPLPKPYQEVEHDKS